MYFIRRIFGPGTPVDAVLFPSRHGRSQGNIKARTSKPASTQGPDSRDKQHGGRLQRSCAMIEKRVCSTVRRQVPRGNTRPTLACDQWRSLKNRRKKFCIPTSISGVGRMRYVDMQRIKEKEIHGKPTNYPKHRYWGRETTRRGYPMGQERNIKTNPEDRSLSHRSAVQSVNQGGQSGQSSSSVSVSVSLVSPASPSVSLSSLEESEGFLVFFGGWPVLSACIWPAMESGNEGQWC